jgi:uncharacterized membrane protein YedE/YeeE
MTTTTFDRPVSRGLAKPSFNLRPVAVSLALVLSGTWYMASAVSWRQGALFIVGAAAGVVLYHAAFGFTSAWRLMITERNGAGLRAQMFMLALTCVVFFPILANGELFGRAVRGSVSPVGLSVVVGAFLFGVGMQLGGGCASGTLYTAGGGSVRMLVTLAAFIVGSVAGVIHQPLWDKAPRFPPISLIGSYGAVAALAMSLAALGAIAAASIVLERRKAAARPDRSSSEASASRWLRGPWPLVAGAIGLAAVNIATLALAGRPWGVTSAFALWGSKMVAATGVDVASWPYWQTRAAELKGSVFNDVTSVMDVGIVLGALAAAGLAGRFAPSWRVPARSLAAAVIGGLLLGYGARIAFGCNIGAYFSGVASSSVHGWLWFVSAFAGNVIGTRFRPLFGLRV